MVWSQPAPQDRVYEGGNPPGDNNLNAAAIRELHTKLGDDAALLDGATDLAARLAAGFRLMLATVEKVLDTGASGTLPERQLLVRLTIAGELATRDVRTLGQVPVRNGEDVWVAKFGAEYRVIGSARTDPNNTRFIATCNAILPAGFYEVNNDANAPSLGWWHIIQTRHTNESSWGWQIAYEMQSDRVFTRRTNGGDPALAASWTPWSLVGGDSGWIRPTLTNGWVDYDARVARYRRLNGVVYFNGLIKNGTTGISFPAFTLPDQYRIAAPPSADWYHFPIVANDVFGFAWVHPDGRVAINGSNVWVDLSNVSFPVT